MMRNELFAAGIKGHLMIRHSMRGLFQALSELGAARMAPPRNAHDAAHRLAAVLGAVGRAHDLVVTRSGDIPRNTALIVANHVSYLDPLAILPLCPAAPITKGEVLGWPVIGPIARELGAVFVRRADPGARARVLRRVHDLLEAGVPVLNFPEGTTTAGDLVEPFWRGTFGIAQRLRVPVVPVAVRYTDRALAWYGGASFVSHYLSIASKPRLEIDLEFGAPMATRTGESAEAMAERARNLIARMLEGSTHAGSRTDVSPPRPDPVLSLTVDDDGRQRRRRRSRRAA